MIRSMAMAAALLATACSDDAETRGSAAPEPGPAVIRYAETANPADPRLAGIYDRACRACHAVRATGAPLTGDAAAWRLRLESKGVDGLSAAVRTGVNAMPAMGLCPDCSDEDFRALINFMAMEAQ